MKTALISALDPEFNNQYSEAQIQLLKETLGEDLYYFWNLKEGHDSVSLSYLLKECERVIVVGPIFWGRLPGRFEMELDYTLKPGFHYKFHNLPLFTKLFGMKSSKGLTNIKEIYWVLNYGSPRVAMFGVPFFRLGIMLSKLILRVPKVKHIPTFLAETSERKRRKTMTKLKRLFS